MGRYAPGEITGSPVSAIANDSLAYFQTKLRQFVYVVTAHGLRAELAYLLAGSVPSATGATEDINPRRVIRDQRIERVHHKIEHFLQVKRATDLFRDVQQQTQLIRGGEFHPWNNRLSNMLSHDSRVSRSNALLQGDAPRARI